MQTYYLKYLNQTIQEIVKKTSQKVHELLLWYISVRYDITYIQPKWGLYSKFET